MQFLLDTDMTPAQVLAHLNPKLRAIGDSLMQRQPACAVGDALALRRTLDDACAWAHAALEPLLLELDPALPLAQPGIRPQQLRAEYPAYWLFDPIDGAVQYLHGLPLWTMTLALLVDGRPVLAWVYHAALGMLYCASQGGGVAGNTKSLSVTPQSDLAMAFLGTSFPNYPPRPQQEVGVFLRRLSAVVPLVLAQRWMGPASLSLCQLAAGQLHGYWEQGSSLYDWLPGMLIASEAGAIVTGLDGCELNWMSDGILAVTPLLQPALLQALDGAVGV
jgi:myo-inositol-1(or 4)-monophosphatase